jgi:hypothetical protein
MIETPMSPVTILLDNMQLEMYIQPNTVMKVMICVPNKDVVCIYASSPVIDTAVFAHGKAREPRDKVHSPSTQSEAIPKEKNDSLTINFEMVIISENTVACSNGIKIHAHIMTKIACDCVNPNLSKG